MLAVAIQPRFSIERFALRHLPRFPQSISTSFDICEKGTSMTTAVTSEQCHLASVWQRKYTVCEVARSLHFKKGKKKPKKDKPALLFDE